MIKEVLQIRKPSECDLLKRSGGFVILCCYVANTRCILIADSGVYILDTGQCLQRIFFDDNFEMLGKIVWHCIGCFYLCAIFT